jgi:hypothetical protein
MKHPSSRQLFAYWTKQRGERPAPERGDIDPAAIRHALADIFILAADFVEDQRFRLAGTRVCALFGRELKGESFGSTWTLSSRQQLRGVLAEVTSENAGLVAGVAGRNAQGDAIDLELLLLPLAHRGHGRVRAIGVLASNELPYWVGEKPVKELTLGTVRHIGGELDAPIAPAAHMTALIAGDTAGQAEGRMKRGFMVYQGGRSIPPNEKAG